MQMIFSSFVLPRELKQAWKKAARAERVSANEFLRQCLSDAVKKATRARKQEKTNLKEED